MNNKIYLASSWKNEPIIKDLAYILRATGNKVFDFTDAENRPDNLEHFCFNAQDWKGTPLITMKWKKFIEYEQTKKAFIVDKAGMDWCDICILILPCNRSSHLEAGYCKGKGKKLIIFGDLPLGEFETLYLLADKCFDYNEINEMLKFTKE